MTYAVSSPYSVRDEEELMQTKHRTSNRVALVFLSRLPLFIVLCVGFAVLFLNRLKAQEGPSNTNDAHTGQSPASLESTSVPKVDWGDEVRGCRLRLVSDKEIYRIGDPINVTICISNTSSREIAVTTVFGWPWDYDFTVLDEDHHKVARTEEMINWVKTNEGSLGGSAYGTQILPNNVFREYDQLNLRYNLKKVGVYTIKAVRQMNYDGTIPAHSGAITIRIVKQ